MLEHRQIDITDLGYNDGGDTLGSTAAWGSTINVDENFAASADCKANVAELAGVLVHEWKHWHTYNDNPTGFNWLGRVVGGGLNEWIPGGYDENGVLRSLNERNPHNTQKHVHDAIALDLKSADCPCCPKGK